tara:strand:- start:195 stop:536 length:342 start_codon:yes stop_codon:yes gene_type:complete
MQIRKNIRKRYDKYVDRNREKIINDFCEEIKKEEVGDLTLDEYSKFRFWKYDQEGTLKTFYKDFKNKTKDDELDFYEFCSFIWAYMDGIDDGGLPDEIEAIIKGLKYDRRAEA